MPELPEVETTRRGIAPHAEGKRIDALDVRDGRLRWPVPATLAAWAQGQTIQAINRRGKYLLLRLDKGTLLVHLGMSGSLRVLPNNKIAQKHDHIDLRLHDGTRLRYNDPRRFGAWLFTEADINQHPLISHLGPEPLSEAFQASYLYACTRRRKSKIKSLIMDARIVVGVGNIYANEALFLSGIYPHKAAGRLSKQMCERLVSNIRYVLNRAIKLGGTTLRDFVGGDGKPGYFAQSLKVYGQVGQACRACGTPIKELRTNQRSTCYCPNCQPR